MSDYSISVEDLHKAFGEKKVLQGLSLNIEKSSIFGLVGLNGTGKTTLIRIFLGLLRPDRGVCCILGMNPEKHSIALYHKTGVILEHSGFFENLTVQENLGFFAEAKRINRSALQEYFTQYWAHTAIGKDDRKVKYFSRGQKMQCALCRAFLGWPEVYFFDEPAVSLDLEAYDQFCTFVRLAQNKGATLIISSHQLETIEELCTHVGILENGRLNRLESFSKGQKFESWVLRTDSLPAAEQEILKIIESLSQGEAEGKEGHWTFKMPARSDAEIARLIERLVMKGISVFEIRPQKETFRSSIRHYYGSAQ